MIYEKIHRLACKAVNLSFETEEKTAQELRPLLKIHDSFKKIVITLNTPRPFYNEDGILMMSVYDFLLNADSLEI